MGQQASIPIVYESKDRFDEVPKLIKEEIPTCGKPHSEFDGLDNAILDLMVKYGIPSSTISVSFRGKLIHSRAFGWGDSELMTPITLGKSFRLASLTKSLTKAVVYELIEEGRLNEDGLVYQLLDLEGKVSDEWKKITVKQLILHQGGWDREVAGDWSFKTKLACEDLGIKLEEMNGDYFLSWIIKKPLEFEPGSKTAYSNIGYIILARIVEKITEKKFHDHLKEKLQMPSLILSRSDPINRDPKENWYCLHPEYNSPEFPFPTRTEARDGCGSIACSSDDYCTFIENYSLLDGRRRKKGEYPIAFVFGSHAGSTSLSAQRRSGICFTFIGNRRASPKAETGKWNKPILEAIYKELQIVVDKRKELKNWTFTF